MASLSIEIHAATGTGPVRKCNEDNYLVLNLSTSEFRTKLKDPDEYVVRSNTFEIDEKGVVLAVSDGCGGALSGDLSSRMTVDGIKKMLTGATPDDSFHESALIEKLYDATLHANRLIHNEGCTNPEYAGMGCTLTAAGVTADCTDFLQVGDSRAYLIRRGRIHPITKDQTLVNKLIDSGQITPEEAETHPLKNVILQALGAQNEIYPVVGRLIAQKNDVLLLCSDGLSNELQSEDILTIILDNINDLKNACQVLIEEANMRHGYDNITVILARLSGGGLTEPTDDPPVVYPLKSDNFQEPES